MKKLFKTLIFLAAALSVLSITTAQSFAQTVYYTNKLEQTSLTGKKGYAQIELDNGPEAFLRAKTYSNGSPKVYVKRAEATMVFGEAEPQASAVDIASETSYYAEAIVAFSDISYAHAIQATTKYLVQNLETLDDNWQRTITLARDPLLNVWYEVED